MAVRAPLARPAAVLAHGRRVAADLADGAETAPILFAYAKAAAQACDLSAELGRRAQKLLAVQPKLRAKGAGAALQALLEDDSLSASSKIGGQMSERGARRLFDRLVALGALRELTGRATFRLWALTWREPGSPQPSSTRNSSDLPAPARWREWMGRVEAVIFASAEPVSRENLARVVGKACNLELIIDDIRDELRGRPYEIVSVAGGWMFRTKLGFGEAIRAALGGPQRTELSRSNALIQMAIGYFQPITRGELSQFFGREVSRDAIAACAAKASSPPGRAARRSGRPTPMSPRRRSSATSASRAFATCRTSRSSRTRGWSGGRAKRFSTATPWRPS